MNENNVEEKNNWVFTVLKFLASQLLPPIIFFCLWLIQAFFEAYILSAFRTLNIYPLYKYFIWIYLLIPSVLLAVYINKKWIAKFKISYWWIILLLLIQIPLCAFVFWNLFWMTALFQ